MKGEICHMNVLKMLNTLKLIRNEILNTESSQRNKGRRCNKAERRKTMKKIRDILVYMYVCVCIYI
jgi:hypothetical protein